MPRHRDRSRPTADGGFTLIEMLVAGLLFSLIFMIIAAIFIASLGVQQTVTDTTSATVDAQLAAQSIDKGVKNAVGVELTGDPGAPAGLPADDQMLVAEVATGDGDPDSIVYNCQAWYFDASAGEIRWRVTALAEVAAPSAAQLAGWTLLADRVTATVPPSVFTHSGASIGVAYRTTVDENSPVAIEFTTASLLGAPLDESTSTCF